ncbi:AMP-binding protein [Xenorhabdus bovienii]|uniref:AMP-binding protein n=1 Tax=Xenorhabdus bovienii TaxID=40576 RepID=UPI003DA48532
MNFLDYLLLSLYRNREKIFLIENDQQISHQQVLSAILTQSRRIRQILTGKNKVYLRETSAFSTLVNFFALLNNNISVALINRNWNEPLTEDIYQLDDEIDSNEDPFSPLALQQALTEEMIRREANDATLSFFSSGSTANKPTEMQVSQDNLLFSLLSISATLRYDNTTRIGVTTPLSFDYSLYQFFMVIATGGAVVYSDFRVKAHRAFSYFSQYRCNYLALIPGILKQYLALYKFSPYQNLPAFITLTGERFEQETLEQCHQLIPEVQIITMYGLTECKRVSITPPELCVIESNCTGIAIPGTRVHIRGKDGILHPEGRGECVTEGWHVTEGYIVEGPCQFKITNKRRILYTRDIIQLDSCGLITFIKRADSIIKVNGKRIDLKTVEHFVSQLYPSACKITYKDHDVIIFGIGEIPPVHLQDKILRYFREAHGVVIRKVILQKQNNMNLKGL